VEHEHIKMHKRVGRAYRYFFHLFLSFLTPISCYPGLGTKCCVFDMSTGQCTSMLIEHTSVATSVSVSPDGKEVVSGVRKKFLS
jgi:WD40 repeat protein